MDDDVIAIAKDIRDMKIRGAGNIAVTASSALASFAKDHKAESKDAFVKDIDSVSKILLDSRPTAVSLWNGVQATIKGIHEGNDVEDIRRIIIENSDAFVEEAKTAKSTIMRIGAKRIEDGDTLMTHCNSSTAIGVIAEAHRQGKDIKVYATESRPWRQGLLTVKDLSKEGIDSTLIIDSAVHLVMKKVDKVFVGADTITSHGALINKIGTSQVALAAHEARVQFYTCVETYKFSPLTLAGDLVKIEERDLSEVVKEGEIPEGVKVFNPVFDVTPSEYIDGVITEQGLIAPGSVYDVMVRKYGTLVME